MNERAALPPTPPTPDRPDRIAALRKLVQSTPGLSPVRGRDREFLPAALEILETPPAPLPVALMLALCAFLAVALAWSFFGRLDVHAVAPGKIETVSLSKVVQPFDNGKIAAIDVANGQRVKAGEVLLELDPAEALADAHAARDAHFEDLAEIARRAYAIAVARTLDAREATDSTAKDFERAAIEAAILQAEAKIGFAANIPANIRLRQRAVMAADLRALADQLAALDRQIAQKEATSQRLNMSIAFENELMVTLNDRVHTRQQAIKLKVGTKINLYDAKEELQKSQSQLASDQGQLIETEAALNELRSEKYKAISQFIADNENKAVDAARKADDAKQSLAKADAKLGRTKLVAPIDGIAQQLTVTTIGQVVTTGQQLLVVAPSQGPIQVEALVANLDIGFVKIGQTAVIKVDAFPFTRFGTLTGKVVDIAQQAVDETEAKRALANVTSSSNISPAQMSGPGQPESFVFPVTISLAQSAMKIGDSEMRLNPGMTVTAEIKTDSRRVIDYLLSPLTKVGSEAMHER
ncbi:MAG TPA: HlyD family type I secretion periplasmic adaptor subunit [Roseiarcus sp.]|nr:HlyD family type I secretion periplasmic adaptor subunit [Roseiarcus sp.]